MRGDVLAVGLVLEAIGAPDDSAGFTEKEAHPSDGERSGAHFRIAPRPRNFDLHARGFRFWCYGSNYSEVLLPPCERRPDSRGPLAPGAPATLRVVQVSPLTPGRFLISRREFGAV